MTTTLTVTNPNAATRTKTKSETNSAATDTTTNANIAPKKKKPRIGDNTGDAGAIATKEAEELQDAKALHVTLERNTSQILASTVLKQEALTMIASIPQGDTTFITSKTNELINMVAKLVNLQARVLEIESMLMRADCITLVKEITNAVKSIKSKAKFISDQAWILEEENHKTSSTSTKRVDITNKNEKERELINQH